MQYLLIVYNLGNYYPDYCIGFLFIVTSKVGMMMAEGARHVFHHKLVDDTYMGLIAESLPDIKLKSLSPIFPISTSLWDKVISHCPAFSFMRNLFNPIVLEAGSVKDDLQYVHNPKFVACTMMDSLNYKYLIPMGISVDWMNQFCSRKSPVKIWSN